MKIYYFTDLESLGDDFVATCAEFFPQWRKDQMLRFRFSKGRIQNALAYLLLIHALMQEGVFEGFPEFSYNEHGKPFLKNYPDWYFNISHCKTTVACALSREPVGLDVEDSRLYKDSLASYVCNEDELRAIQNSDDVAGAFCRLWTRKEAVFKYSGTGITDNLKNILQNDEIVISSVLLNSFGDKDKEQVCSSPDYQDAFRTKKETWLSVCSAKKTITHYKFGE